MSLSNMVQDDTLVTTLSSSRNVHVIFTAEEDSEFLLTEVTIRVPVYGSNPANTGMVFVTSGILLLVTHIFLCFFSCFFFIGVHGAVCPNCPGTACMYCWSKDRSLILLLLPSLHIAPPEKPEFDAFSWCDDYKQDRYEKFVERKQALGQAWRPHEPVAFFNLQSTSSTTARLSVPRQGRYVVLSFVIPLPLISMWRFFSSRGQGDE